MLISFGYGNSFDMDCDLHYQEGIELIENVKNIVKEKNTIDMAVLKGLSSLKDYWESNVFFSEIYGGYRDFRGQPLTILKEGLSYFSDKRRKLKFSDCGERLQELFDSLKTYVVEEKEIQAINEINQVVLQHNDHMSIIYDIPMTSQDFLKYAECMVKKTGLLDRYTNKDYKRAISRQRFIINTVQEIGISDSCMAQILYSKLANNIRSMEREENDTSYWSYFTSEMEETARNLEIYRCIIDESSASKKELLMEYRPCIS